MKAIQRDFGRQTGSGREDPVVHFYELFLSAYDKAQKVQRGVFYTPDPVVSYIVRSVDYLLKTEFGLEDGLADTSVDPETGEPLVQILDPATGTGTFLAHVIDCIEKTVKAKPDVDWNDYVSRHLLPRRIEPHALEPVETLFVAQHSEQRPQFALQDQALCKLWKTQSYQDCSVVPLRVAPVLASSLSFSSSSALASVSSTYAAHLRRTLALFLRFRSFLTRFINPTCEM